jgi:NAD(P)-dependent dehydrogenase (short-subunit alcohol dehydrogenase family)
MRRTILVTGATGKQGSALIRALLSHNHGGQTRNNNTNISTEDPSTDATAAATATTTHSLDANGDDDVQFYIYALTRKADSPRSQQWAGEAAVTVIEGDLDRPESISKIFEDAKAAGAGGGDGEAGIWGIYAVLAFPGLGVAADGEERQGKVGRGAFFFFFFLYLFFAFLLELFFMLACALERQVRGK